MWKTPNNYSNAPFQATPQKQERLQWTNPPLTGGQSQSTSCPVPTYFTPCKIPAGAGWHGPDTPWHCPFAHGSNARSWLASQCLAKAHGRRLSEPGTWENGDNIRKKQKHLTYLLLPSHPALGDASSLWTESAPGLVVPQLSMELLPAPGLGLLARGIPCAVCHLLLQPALGAVAWLFPPCLGWFGPPVCVCECSSPVGQDGATAPIPTL